MELPSELAVATHLDVDALIKRQSQEIEGLVHIAAALAGHVLGGSAGPAPRSGIIIVPRFFRFVGEVASQPRWPSKSGNVGYQVVDLAGPA